MVPATTSLTRFSGETTWPLGQLRLLVTIEDATHSTKAWMNFMVVKSLSPYNGIIGRPGLKAIQVVPSTVHRMLKFPTKEGIVTIRSSLLIPAECASIGTSFGKPREERTYPANFTVALHPNFLDQEVVVGGSLSDRGRTELCALLKKNLDIFAWQPFDMTGVPREYTAILRCLLASRPATDGQSVRKTNGAKHREGVEFTYALRFQFAASNNEAEYEALIAGLWIATQIGVKNVQANVDFKL
nr:reverse transcriptase domain-containing protein [Tanacetum cinerariifolium]